MNEIISEARIREIVRDEISNFTPVKKKRAPNKWQLFLKDCTKRQEEKLPYTEKVQLCSLEYRNSKGANNQSSQQSQQSQQKDDKPVYHNK